MARWRLKGKHYLSVPGTEWEHREQSDTGKQVKKIYQVPLYLDPDTSSDHNYPGEIIVCYEGKGHPRDIVFTGPPTPEMEPLDDGAKVISGVESRNWVHPIESLPGTFDQSIISALERKMVEAKPAAEPSVSRSEFEALQQQLAELMAQNAELQERSGRRV